jgi:hypothetical protein
MSMCFQSSPVYCSWPSPAHLFLFSGPVGTHDQIFVRSKTIYIFRYASPLRREEELVFLSRRHICCTAYLRSHCVQVRALYFMTSNKETSMKYTYVATCLALISCLDYSITLKIETICSSETSIDFQRTIWSHIPENRTLHNHRCKGLKSYYLI